jgi:periplasmic divalent cation tolerance protein
MFFHVAILYRYIAIVKIAAEKGAPGGGRRVSAMSAAANPIPVIVVTTATETRADADRIAEHLVAERLAACVQVSPIASCYRWHGAVERADEWLCTIKTRADRFAAVERAVRALHPYEVPELLATPVWAGGHDYVAWIASETESMPSTDTSSEP